VLPSVDSFLRERMEFYFRDVLGLRYDTVRAVLAPISQQSSPPVRDTWRMPSGALKITQSLERVRNTEDFMAMAAAAKRTRNILSKSAREENIAGGTIDLSLLTESAEKDLANAYLDLKEDIKSFTASGNYEQAFRLMAGIRPQVDRFFDQVLVLTEELPVRRNRLSLLARLNEDLFTGLADLAEIAVEPRSGATSGA
jgi:glycyl-tRNA synthetase beta chain